MLRVGGDESKGPMGLDSGRPREEAPLELEMALWPRLGSVSSVTPWLPQAGRERIFCPQVLGHLGGNSSAGSVPFPGALGRLRGPASLEAWPSPLDQP